MNRLADLAAVVLQKWGLTPDVLARGWYELEITMRGGAKRTVRLTMVEPAQRKPLLERYSAANDPTILLLEFLPSELATDAFLDSVSPISIIDFSRCALALFVAFLAPMLDSAGGELQNSMVGRPNLN